MKHLKNPPFVYGKIAEKKEFTNREEDTEFVIQNFLELNTIILIAPRRWGKSSLIKHAAQKLLDSKKKYKVAKLDLFNVKSEGEFYSKLASSVIKAHTSKIEDLVQKYGKFSRSIMPKLSFSPMPDAEFTISIDWEDAKKHKNEIINMAEQLSLQSGYKALVCIDEFQNIGHFEDPIGFQKELRSYWQTHQNVCYCLYGSREQMMRQVFSDKKMPFYKFGQIINQQKIKEEKWIPFITSRFEDTGKSITSENAKYIVEITENHPYYIQQVSQNARMLTDEVCTTEIIDLGLDRVIEQSNPFYLREMENISRFQSNFIHLMVNDETEHTTQRIIKKYSLRSTANVVKIRKDLEEKDVIRYENKKILFVDPIFKLWLKRVYFTSNI